MKLRNLLLSALLMHAPVHAMQLPENAAATQVTLENYERSRDLEPCLALFQEDWDNQYIGKPYDPKLAQWLIEIPYKPEGNPSLTHSYNKVFRLNNQTIGFITYYSHNKRPNTADKQLDQKREGYVELFSIAKSNRNQGIEERALREQVLPQLIKNGAEYLVAYLNKNDENIQLFEKLGYTKHAEVYRGKGWQMVKTNFSDIDTRFC